MWTDAASRVYLHKHEHEQASELDHDAQGWSQDVSAFFTIGLIHMLFCKHKLATRIFVM
jgi:hypothetical protein